VELVSHAELLTGWGGTSPTAAEVLDPADAGGLGAALAAPPDRGVIARGLGRSYGDAAQNAGGRVVRTTAVAGIGPVSPEGVVTVDAGASVGDLLHAIVPLGWFVPVTPGTRHVTVGGAIAADIHGKNHHRDGSWCQHVLSMRLCTPDGEVHDLAPDRDADLFWATAGGLGLTGVVVDATIRLRSIETSRLCVDTDRAKDLDAAFALMSEADRDSRYSVAWIDLVARGRQLGRSIVTRGDFATREQLPARDRSHDSCLTYKPHAVAAAPPGVPSGLLNRFTIRAFNEVWFRAAPRRRRGDLQSITYFFHPLDLVEHWNRLYGPRGFLQWQPVVPFGEEETLRHIVEALSSTGCASFLAVLKRLGPGNAGPMSFPAEGWTLSLDIPAGGAELGALLDRLDELVAAAGGRVYLAKDSRLRPELLPVMYPRLDEWRAVQRRADPKGVLRSDLDRRLGLTVRP
jgi:decaprenylphospho-beta-D-ribofuranose 2-oxidase